MAESDISWDILCDTEATTAPSMQKTKIMERNRDSPCFFIGLFRFSFMLHLHSLAFAIQRSR